MKQSKSILLGCVIGVGVSITSAMAQENPVLVELFTSQGCSSCPPADDILQELAEQPGVVALAFHVDYWDYIGWVDQFAQPLFTERQKAYAQRAGAKMIYTPQMIIQGQDFIIGSHSMEIGKSIMDQSHHSSGLTANIRSENGGITITINGEVPANIVQAPEIFLVQFDPMKNVYIERGENAGREMEYANVVTQMHLIQEYTAPKWQMHLDNVQNNAAVIVQERNHGRVLATAIIR